MILLPRKRTTIKDVRRFEKYLNKVFYTWFADYTKKPSLDLSTVRHCERTSWLSALIMDRLVDENAKLGNLLDEKSIVFWRSVALMSGLLHDTGKVVFSEKLLNYQTRLSEEDWETIIRHPNEGFCMVMELLPKGWREEEYFVEVLNAIKMHHERWDGQLFSLEMARKNYRGGYPSGLMGDEISLVARVVKIADAYDAMVARNRGNRNVSKESLGYVITFRGKEFDPLLVEVFCELYHKIIEPIEIYVPGLIGDESGLF